MADILSQAKACQGKIAIDKLIYDPINRQLMKSGKEIELEPRSLELLEVLLQQTGAPIAADEIIDKVWQSNFISKNVLTNRISTLRTIFKEHSPDSDATKLLVTYPKKGYYLNSARVSLVEVPDSEIKQQPVKVKPSIHLIYASLLLLVSAALITQYFQSSTPLTQASSHITVPVVELLLHKINATDETAKPYVKAIKTSLLAQQIFYPYINVINQDAPTYFLSPLDDSPYWPGSRNTLFSDYKLNLRLSKGALNGELFAQLELVFHNSEKQIYRGEYALDITDLDSGIYKMTEDLVMFFGLPEQAQEKNSDTFDFLSTPMSSQLANHDLTVWETNYMARLLLLDTDVGTQTIKSWLEHTERRFPLPSEETEIWLGLLNFKIGDHESARERLFKARFNNQIHNAFVYLVLSDIALKDNNPDLFRLYYLKSLVSLSLVTPSQEIFKQLTQDQLYSKCLGTWGGVIKSKRVTDNMQAWINMFEGYCERAKPYLLNTL
ncbi:transcriptional regulator [Shewanella atlantica]|uniref:winged helix-turn-helix domain-containing protein n=1 Tax=Shewanella atlantica TaxID=271099 RepID=UPI0037368E30